MTTAPDPQSDTRFSPRAQSQGRHRRTCCVRVPPAGTSSGIASRKSQRPSALRDRLCFPPLRFEFFRECRANPLIKVVQQAAIRSSRIMASAKRAARRNIPCSTGQCPRGLVDVAPVRKSLQQELAIVPLARGRAVLAPPRGGIAERLIVVGVLVAGVLNIPQIPPRPFAGRGTRDLEVG